MTVAAVLVAAGSGSRLGHQLPKAFVPLRGVPLVVHAARSLLACDAVSALVVVVPADRAADARDAETMGRLADGAAVIYNCVNPPYHRWPADWPPIAASVLSAAERSGAVSA